MKNIMLAILAFVILVMSTVFAADNKLPQIANVYQNDRSDNEDVIYFRNKDVLRGQVVNEAISIATQYGMVEIPVRKCAGISFEGARSNTESVVTVNFNRLTGIITDNTIQFKIGSSGTVIPIRKEKIRYVLLKKTSVETEFLKDLPKSDLFVMANGDLLSGESVDRKITIATDYAKIPVSFAEMKTVQMQGGDNVTAILVPIENARFVGI